MENQDSAPEESAQTHTVSWHRRSNLKTAWVRQGDQLTNLGSVLEWQGSDKTFFVTEALVGAIFFCSLSTCLASHWHMPFLLLSIILVKQMLPPRCSPEVFSPAQHTHPEGLSKAASSPPRPASVLCQHQWPLQSSCCSRGSALNHSMFTTTIARLQSQSQWGPVPRFHKLTAITCRPLCQLT